MTLTLGRGAIILEIGLWCVVKQDSDYFTNFISMGHVICPNKPSIGVRFSPCTYT